MYLNYLKSEKVFIEKSEVYSQRHKKCISTLKSMLSVLPAVNLKAQKSKQILLQMAHFLQSFKKSKNIEFCKLATETNQKLFQKCPGLEERIL